MNVDGVLLTATAAEFAAKRHVNQRRKGAQAEPYVNHLAEVAALLAGATKGKDAALVAAGICTTRWKIRRRNTKSFSRFSATTWQFWSAQ